MPVKRLVWEDPSISAEMEEPFISIDKRMEAMENDAAEAISARMYFQIRHVQEAFEAVSIANVIDTAMLSEALAIKWL